jgi:putative nucleotidyltransferase with HDIG domain
MSWPGRHSPESSGQAVPARTECEGLLDAAQRLERNAKIPEAIACLEAAIADASRSGQKALVAEALRRLAIIRYRRDERVVARSLAEQSYQVASTAGLSVAAAEALNTLGVQHLQTGNLAAARLAFMQALAIGCDNRSLHGRAEQNLGIVANIQGHLDEAVAHYARSLEAYSAGADEHGCAIAYHNLGMASVDRERLDDAERHFRDSAAIASRIGDLQLRAQCLVSQAELDVTRQRFENARQGAEEALALFDRLGVSRGKADAYRVIGMVYREIGRLALAESRLTAALDLAVASDAALIEAETARELAVVYQATERNQDALKLLSRAHRLFRRLEARSDLINIGAKLATLQGTYFSVVREWGQSIEANDSSTFGHCERVARSAVLMARELGFSEAEETELLVGAYLHDVGMVRVPHEILTKQAPLTAGEQAVIDQHPLWGDELLAGIEFPWAVQQIVRWHHEHCDGSGHPDGLSGDRIPLSAQVVGILDTYDGFTMARFGRAALPSHQGIWEILARRSWWSPRVFDAFMRVIR